MYSSCAFILVPCALYLALMQKSLLILALFLINLQCFSQDTLHFSQGLMVNATNRYGREAIYTDQLAWLLYNHALNTPVAGGPISAGERYKNSTWEQATADSVHRFRMRGGFGGGSASYLYLTYTSAKEQTALLNSKGTGSVYVNGVPHMGDAYASGWLYIPVKLKKGLNEFYLRGGLVSAALIFEQKPLLLNTEDATLPHIVLNNGSRMVQGAIVVINNTGNWQKELQVKAVLAQKEMVSALPDVPPMSSRKIIVDINTEGISQKGHYDGAVVLMKKNQAVDSTKITLDAVTAAEKYSNTFISAIDGSLQYYAVTPQTPTPTSGSALFLSVHGAGVEAIGQAKAYQSKDWGTLVAATNRRPRGFNWEDWGRLDALEVLNIAKARFQPDPNRIYLTGHSMGGHGTWFLGATYAAQWAGIAPCSGYPTLKGYGSADGLIPDSSKSPMEQMLLRASNQSDVPKLATNYKPLGVYVLHGDSDKVVSVRYARQMKKLLADFHTDMSYYEYPGGEHWFGDQSVDWKPLFDFFKWHTRLPDSVFHQIDFITANPGISAVYRWATIYQQQHPLQYSRMQLTRNVKDRTITGTTENIRLLKLQLTQFGSQSTVHIQLDSQQTVAYTTTGNNDSLFLINENGTWRIINPPSIAQKGPHRYGTFKEAFNNHMVFVYATGGSKEEQAWSFNKARYDAETWYYRGNGAVDIIADKEYALTKYAGRGVVLYGNAATNAAWKILLSDCPVQVNRNQITVGDKKIAGDDLAAYFIWPLRNSSVASVAVIGGTGIKGMNAANANQYFAGGSGFPDYMIFRLNMLQDGVNGIEMAGFFDNEWKLTAEEMITR